MSPRSDIALVLPLIRTVRGRRVILDSDLARLYGVSTSRLNEQVKRNQRRFPKDFAFRLTPREAAGLSQIATAQADVMLSQSATAAGGRNLSKPPVAFTEHGAVMAANVLNSERAVTMSVEVVRAFIRLRRAALGEGRLARKLSELESAVRARLDTHDRELESLFQAVQKLIDAEGKEDESRKRIGFIP